MIKYKIYILLSTFLFGAALISLIGLLTGTDNDSFVYIALIQIGLGCMQLISGTIAKVKVLANEKPKWIQFGVDMYWRLNGVYFAVLLSIIALIYLTDAESSALYTFSTFWVFVVPWGIALYQFTLVLRIYKWRKSNKAFPVIANPKF